jgi:hypothetical protein
VLYYQYRDGGPPVWVAEPDLASYSRTNRRDRGGLGFIAGGADIVGWLFEQLQANWAK